MSSPERKFCPGTLAAGHSTYSSTCLRRLFNGRKIHHLLPYDSPATDEATDKLFEENRKRISISGVQEKFSVLLDKNKIRLVHEGEQGTHILKPVPNTGKNPDQMPSNEHLTMQIARQVFDIETAENALIFFKNGVPAYITKRFDIREEGVKWATEDFASLAGRTPQTHGEHYKYSGNYLELFDLMKKLLPAYQLEAPKLFKQLAFNYLFSNGDAHFKNFSVMETPLGDYRLSPAYDMLNSRIHIDDPDFALEEGLLPRKMTKGNVPEQFRALAGLAELNNQQVDAIFHHLLSGTNRVEALIQASFLNESAKSNYLQAYKRRYKKLSH
ncbi:MAG: HipA domain-containing protein [Bacteroidales bacterium]|nr:HipA domain-containing protein [Bacteroidales bacterium]